MPFEPRATKFSMANAQILAQAAAVAYRDPQRCEKWAKTSGFTGAFDFFDNKDTQGFVAESNDAILVAFRGTQPDRAMDWFVDAGAVHGKWDHDTGTVHTGFYNALRAVWGVTLAKGEVLPKRLLNRGSKTIWITGHSLGGALAVLCAAQAVFVSKIDVQGVYTFGQPRVGNKAFADAVSAKLGSGVYRFVNHRDIVPRVPLFSAQFCHYGNQTFFDENGKPTEQASAVETLAGALKFGSVVFNLHLIGQAFSIIKDSLEHEQAFKETAKSLLKLGVEKIDDHNMEMHYLARLNTKLPPE
jgi:triacylglycerol lipase